MGNVTHNFMYFDTWPQLMGEIVETVGPWLVPWAWVSLVISVSGLTWLLPDSPVCEQAISQAPTNMDSPTLGTCSSYLATATMMNCSPVATETNQISLSLSSFFQILCCSE